MKTLILTNGFGTRMFPLTEYVNKTMIPIAGKPILEHVVKYLQKYGFQDIVMAVGVLKEQVINYFGDGQRWGVNIEYSLSDEPQGTAGELAKAKTFFEHDKDFLIYYGDTLTATNLTKFYQFHKLCGGTITLNGIRGLPIETGIIEYVHQSSPTTGDYAGLTVRQSSPTPQKKRLTVRQSSPSPQKNNPLLPWKPHLSEASERLTVTSYKEKGIVDEITSIPVFFCAKRIFKSENIRKGKDFSYDVIPEFVKTSVVSLYIETGNYHYDIGTFDRLKKVSEMFNTGKVGEITVVK